MQTGSGIREIPGMIRAIVVGALAAAFFSQPLIAADHEEGKKEEKRACVACHGLRIIHVQRLPRAAWERELTKMEGWGAVIKNRQALLDYLAASFSDTQPPAPVLKSGDGRKKGNSGN